MTSSPRKLQRVDRTRNYELDGFDGLDGPAMDASWALFRDLDMFPHRLWPVWPYGRIRFPFLHIVATTGRRSSFLHDGVASDTYGDLDSAVPTSRTPLQYSVCKVRATQVPQSSPQTRATGPQTRHRPVPMYPYRHRCQKGPGPSYPISSESWRADQAATLWHGIFFSLKNRMMERRLFRRQRTPLTMARTALIANAG